MDEHFNLALFPQSSEFEKLCVELAKANLSEQADGYLLGFDALPHVTVCQFLATPEKLPSVWASLEDLSGEPLSLGFRHLYIQYGKAELSGKCWLGLAVKPESGIIEFQKNVFARLLETGIESRNAPDTYFPHITFARCDATKPSTISLPPPESIWLNRYEFRLTLAESDEHGRYHKQLFP